MDNFLGEKQFNVSLQITTKGNPKKILLLHHKKAGVWLQPGGHIEKTENPIEALIREVQEETGLDVREYFQNSNQTDNSIFLPVPKYLLEEKIEEHVNHPFHYHIDLQYHIEMDEVPVTHSEKEAHAIGWFGKEEALKLPLFDNTRKIIEDLLS